MQATQDPVFYRCWVGLTSNEFAVFRQSEYCCLVAPVTMPARLPDCLDRSEVTLPSFGLLNFLSLSSTTDLINVCSCVASGAAIAFILLSTSLVDNLHSSD